MLKVLKRRAEMLRKEDDMLEDKVTLITGASQGLGRALALAFAKEGARVVVNARSEESVRPVAEEVEEAGAEVTGRCGGRV